MKLSAAFSILLELRVAVQAAFFPTIQAVMGSPSLLYKPTALSRLFMARVWSYIGNGVDENGRPVKQNLITPNASGVVLDLGAGFGHTVHYLDRSRVTKYIALEPNTHMHQQLRAVANAAGFSEADGTLLILSCGAEDTASILSSVNEGGNRGLVDTVISILTLCTVPSPEETIASLMRDVLKPGGQLLFYEHVLSPRSDVAWWQRFWAPVWEVAFDGCRLDRPTHLWIERVSADDSTGSTEGIWSEKAIWGKEGDPEENLFWHRAGRLIKRIS